MSREPGKKKCTLHVCTSCRPAGWPREPKDERPGFQLFKELEDRLHASSLRDSVDLKAAECLSLCPRPCGIAFSSAGSWTYLFGDQSPNTGVDAIIDCVSRYLMATDGLMPRNDRPPSLQGSVLGRVPPLTQSELS